MNFIFSTQGAKLDIFNNLSNELKNNFQDPSVCGAFIADKIFFEDYSQENKISFDHIATEWQCRQNSQVVVENIQLKINELETKYGDPFLWRSIKSDRRISFGPHYAYKQDYLARMTHEELQNYLYWTITEIESLFEKVKPNFTCGFICTTLGDYILYLVSRAHRVPYINLRPTRILNYFIGAESIHEPSEFYENNFCLNSKKDSFYQKEVEVYLKKYYEESIGYEGVIKPRKKYSSYRQKGIGILRLLKNFSRQIDLWRRKRYGDLRFDPQLNPVFTQLLYNLFFRRYKSQYANFILRKTYKHAKSCMENEINSFAFYPLHTEPEVTLSVYSSNYTNQIESIRSFAASLPLKYKLIVKEHPWAIGKRSMGFYKKIISIPNVEICDPSLTTKYIIERSSLVMVTAGSVALEGAILGKPVIAIGNTPFTSFPKNMIMHSKNLSELDKDIDFLIKNYKFDNEFINKYIAYVISNSVPIDFYSLLSKRREVIANNEVLTNDQQHLEYKKQITSLSEYLMDRVRIFNEI